MQDPHKLITNHVALLKDGVETHLLLSEAIYCGFTAIHNSKLSWLVIEHAQKLSALLGEFCTHLRPYKTTTDLSAVYLSPTCVNVHSSALIGVQGSAD